MICIDKDHHLIGEFSCSYHPGSRYVECVIWDIDDDIEIGTRTLSHGGMGSTVRLQIPVEDHRRQFRLPMELIEDSRAIQTGNPDILRSVMSKLCQSPLDHLMLQDRLTRFELYNRVETMSYEMVMKAPVLSCDDDLSEALFDMREFTPH